MANNGQAISTVRICGQTTILHVLVLVLELPRPSLCVRLGVRGQFDGCSSRRTENYALRPTSRSTCTDTSLRCSTVALLDKSTLHALVRDDMIALDQLPMFLISRMDQVSNKVETCHIKCQKQRK
jgi:hypothetical protein